MDSIARPPVRIGEWISEGFRMFTEQWKGWVSIALGFFGVVVLPIGALIVAFYVSIFATMASRPPARGAPPDVPVELILLFYVGMFGVMAVLLPVTVLIMGGAYRAAFKQLRGGRIEFRDLFSARDCYWRLVGATLLQSVFVAIGFVLCIVPALLVSGLLCFTMPLIVDRNLGVLEAMRASHDLTRRNMLRFTLFAVLVQLIASIGSQACYVGLLATWPLQFTISAVAFRDCFGVEGARSFSQKASDRQAGYEAAPSVYGAPAVAQSIACPNCQSALPATARFCYHCGWNLSA